MFLPHTPASYVNTTLSMLEQTDLLFRVCNNRTCWVLPVKKTCVNTALQLSVLSTVVPASAVWLFFIALDRTLRKHPAIQTTVNLPNTEFDCHLIFCGSKSNHFYYAKSLTPSSRLYKQLP